MKGTDEITKKNIKSLKESGEVLLLGLDTKLKAKQNGDMIILGYENLPEKDKIEKAFNDIK